MCFGTLQQFIKQNILFLDAASASDDDDDINTRVDQYYRGFSTFPSFNKASFSAPVNNHTSSSYLEPLV